MIHTKLSQICQQLLRDVHTLLIMRLSPDLDQVINHTNNDNSLLSAVAKYNCYHSVWQIMISLLTLPHYNRLPLTLHSTVYVARWVHSLLQPELDSYIHTLCRDEGTLKYGAAVLF